MQRCCLLGWNLGEQPAGCAAAVPVGSARVRSLSGPHPTPSLPLWPADVVLHHASLVAACLGLVMLIAWRRDLYVRWREPLFTLLVVHLAWQAEHTGGHFGGQGPQHACCRARQGGRRPPGRVR